MSGTPDVATDAQRYPIGRFQRQAEISTEQRAEHIARIAAQPANLAAAISGLSASDFAAPYRPGGWSVRQLVHHMADSHANAYIRVKLALTEHEPTIKPYDQDAWVALADSELVSPLVSLTMFTAIHERLVAVLHSLEPAPFARKLVHPENGPMTIDQVVALYAWHGDHHVRHIQLFRESR
ncbi:YfiT family bacillithiol transferase [Gemmatimonas groenlandica]|uniref:Putative metal-dependent hydrolase n=1 Tax=Gemmatimonas groenlandica TaxID=2732249 RepID=A0A6M4ILX7_9BACT|nr:putative metal-dependent hydrolase [Gemmatimonas groenlandica]QJR35670.1 putative metal-dependent hydrolase [Gemmatimonas groenlandica]